MQQFHHRSAARNNHQPAPTATSEPPPPPPPPERRRGRLGPWPPKFIDPFVPRADHNPAELKSWAKRTGFNPNFSGESTAFSTASTTVLSVSERDERHPDSEPEDTDLERRLAAAAAAVGGGLPSVRSKAVVNNANTRDYNTSTTTTTNYNRRPAEIDPVAQPRAAPAGVFRIPELELGSNRNVSGLPSSAPPPDAARNHNNNSEAVPNGLRNAAARVLEPLPQEEAKDKKLPIKDLPTGGREPEVEIDMFPGSEEPGDPFPGKTSGLNCDLLENPGFPRLLYYGLQHYLSMAGSLVLIPLIMVPAMGGSDKETATVISTMLLVSGITTLLHSYLGTRLPLVQGSSFVYLAPALVVINSDDFRNLSDNKFKNIMRELQGAIIVGSLFQTILGYSGFISLLLRFINPVVVAPTIAAVGLAYFGYGFPQAGNCAEISIPLILLVLIFTLYLRRVSLFGHRLFLIYAVPLSIAIVWACAFFVTTGGAYSFNECSPNVPSSNILLDDCRKHAITMKHCRTDVSNAWRTAAWVRIPYPFQWGSPTFHFKTSFIMVLISLVASVDSVGTYHATSLMINVNPPTPGIVSRGIGFEGSMSILAGLWGTGTGATTLTENIHTIDVTKMASRRAVELGAGLLILFSFVGKIGAILASIPLALAASVLCFIWALIVALGLSTMQYTQAGSSRNMIIVGFSLFISLSIPAYIQQYQPISSLILPGYLIPYGAASSGPVKTSSQSMNYVMNSLLSVNMVVAFFVAFLLDNTVPGNKQERGAYIWSTPSKELGIDPTMSHYQLPRKVGQLFRWARWVGS